MTAAASRIEAAPAAAGGAPHVPVLLDQVLALTAPEPGETVVDCTFGAGGHAVALAARIGPTGELI